MSSTIRLLVGLGNPTAQHEFTRHNIGRLFVRYLLTESKSEFVNTRQAEVFRLPNFFGVTLERELCVAQLDCFMNESGPSVKALMMKEGAKPEETLIVIDDFMIPFGTIRFRTNGSAGGHNGLKSVIEALETDEFPRLRFGIGTVPQDSDVVPFVLGRIPKDERDQLPRLFSIAKQGLSILISEGLQNAQTVLNKNHL